MEISNEFLMKYDDDRNRFWLEITGLDKKSIYSYQYLVDGSIYVADQYSPIILDSYNHSSVGLNNVDFLHFQLIKRQ